MSDLKEYGGGLEGEAGAMYVECIELGPRRGDLAVNMSVDSSRGLACADSPFLFENPR